MTTFFSRKGTLIALSLISIWLLAGCSNNDVQVNLEEELQMRDDRISHLEEQARQSQASLEMSQKAAKDATQRAAAAQANANTTIPASLDSELLPPNAKSGECYARVLIAPVFETTSERMLVKEASSTISIIPAKYEWIEEQIIVKAASEKLIVIPATYKTVEEKMLVKEASSRMVEVPAVYGTESEEILVTPAREYWKKGRGPVEKLDGGTGEIMCLISEPAIYKTVTKTVLKSEATTREESIPAEYKTVTWTVVDTPPLTRTETIPAQYGTVKVRKVISPAREVRTPIEAEYRTVTKRVMTEPSYMEWRQILCETNMNNTTILEIQNALKDKGFDPGPLDGIHGRETQTAINAFQKSTGIPSGALTYETIKALGLNY